MTTETVSTRALIEQFLSYRRIAIAGVSRDANDFSRKVFDEFRSRGYNVVPVNPTADTIRGVPCVASVSDVRPLVKAVLIMTPPMIARQVLNDCAYAGVELVWLHKGIGAGAVSQEAIEFCQDRGIAVIPGLCPFLFFDHMGFIHDAHVVVKKLAGSYPN